MTSAVPPAAAEREGGWLLLALAAFLILPLATPWLRALAPIEETLVLLLPALAACAVVGWWAGGGLLLAAVCSAAAAAVVLRGVTPGSFPDLARGWSLLLAGGFGLICLLAPRRPFFSRAIAAVGLALGLATAVELREPLAVARTRDTVHGELARRNTESAALLRRFYARRPGLEATLPAGMHADVLARETALVSATSVALLPALLSLESLGALALAWALYHRLARTRLGAPLGRARDFRFNDQLIWGLIAGLALVFVPALAFLHGLGRNLLVFFGALYAIRGVGVLSWFIAPGPYVVALLLGLVVLWWPVLHMIALLGIVLLAFAIFGLGLGDTWADWRRRTHPTT